MIETPEFRLPCIFQPVLTKRITRKNIEWRIRNLAYAIDTYQVTADTDKNAIVVRTTNKKYFKEIAVPELKRCGLIPDQTHISVAHQHNTLIISVGTKQSPKLQASVDSYRNNFFSSSTHAVV